MRKSKLFWLKNTVWRLFNKKSDNHAQWDLECELSKKIGSILEFYVDFNENLSSITFFIIKLKPLKMFVTWNKN